MRHNMLLLFAVAASAALAACGGGDPPGQNVICVTSVAPDPVLYPTSGATGVPDGNFSLVLGWSEPTVSLAINGTVVVPDLPAASLPSPSPSATYPPNAVAYAVPSLQTKTTYQVIGALPLSGCYDPKTPPSPQTGTLGTFTTK
jgi:hypothetical protein